MTTVMSLITDGESGIQYYKIHDKSSVPADWVNDPDEFGGFPWTADFKGFKFPSERPIPILASPALVCYLFADNDRFYRWFPVAGSLERVEDPKTIEGILERLQKGQRLKLMELC